MKKIITAIIAIGLFFTQYSYGQFDGPLPIGINYLKDSHAAWGDMDNDGDMDLIMIGQFDVGGEYRDTVFLYENTGSGGNYELDTIMNLPFRNLSHGKAVWGDYDNDGDLDLLIGGKKGALQKELKIFQNKKIPTSVLEFEEKFTLTMVSEKSLDWADFDNDGDLDVITVGSKGEGIDIYENTGTNFSVIKINSSGYQDNALVLGDFNSDGNLDFICSGEYPVADKKTDLYLNNGNFNFSILAGANLPGVHKGSLAAGDIDADGDLDVLINGYEGVSQKISAVYYNNGYGSFSFSSNLPRSAVSEGDIALMDVNGDGLLDVGYCGKKADDNAFLQVDTCNPANFSFGVYADISSGDQSAAIFNGSVTFVDYNNDGFMDLLATGDNSTTLTTSYLYQHIYNFGTPASSPNTPISVSSTVEPNADSVIISWSRGTDNNTPALSLTYNIAVGHISGNPIQVASPGSDLVTGYRRVIKSGNAGQDTFLIIRNLPNNTYYFQIQSIDHSFWGSPFSNEISFIINHTELPEALTDSADQITKTSARLNGYVDPKGNNMDTWFIIWDDNGFVDTIPTDQDQISSPSPITKSVTGLIKGHKYYFKAKAVTSGTSDIYYGEVKSFTTQGIVISNVSTTAQPISLSSDFTVTVHAYGDPVPNLTIFWGSSKPGSGEQNVQMDKLDDTTHQKTINFSGLGLSSMWFRVTAENTTDTAHYPSEKDKENVSVEMNTGDLISIRDSCIFAEEGGLTCSGWHSTSLPYDLGGAGIELGGSNVFNEAQDFNTRDGYPRNWSAYRVNQGTSNLTDVISMESGVPYFIYHTYDIQYLDDHINAARTMDVNFYNTYLLNTGWNLIPWVYNYDMNFTVNPTYIQGDVQYMKGNSWVITTKFKPYQAYAIYCKQNGVKISDAITPVVSDLKKVTLNQNEWHIQFKTDLPGRTDHFNFVGVRNGASEGYDTYDASKPWDMKTNVRVYFPLVQDGRTVQLYKNYLPSGGNGYVWDMMIDNPIHVHHISLSWERMNLPDSYKAVLIDFNNNQEIDLRNSDRHEFKARETNPFKIIIGSESFIESEIKKLNLPDKFTLYSNYPNPFNPGTTIQYDLKLGSTVKLSVYNSLGQLVRTLVNGKTQTTGSYSAYWDGKDALGRQVSTGVYIYRIDVKDINGKTFRKSNKMLLLK